MMPATNEELKLKELLKKSNAEVAIGFFFNLR